MDAKDLMIDDYQRNQESPWLQLAKRIVREHVARKAQHKEQEHEGIYRIQISQTRRT